MEKVILVSGASAGIGRECATHLTQVGWTVVGASRRVSSSAGWHELVMDVDQDDSVSAGVSEVIGRFGAVRIGQHWALETACDNWVFQVIRWSGRRGSNWRSQLGKQHAHTSLKKRTL